MLKLQITAPMGNIAFDVLIYIFSISKKKQTNPWMKMNQFVKTPKLDIFNLIKCYGGVLGFIQNKHTTHKKIIIHKNLWKYELGCVIKYDLVRRSDKPSHQQLGLY